jgi:translation elongation factor EF-G
MSDQTSILIAGLRQASYRAICRDVEATGRYVRQSSCPGHFAIVTLRLELDFGPDAVTFVNLLNERSQVWCVLGEDPAEANHTLGTDWEPFVAEVAEGVREALASRSPDGAPIQALKVSLVGMRVHPVDSRVRDFKQAAVLALTEALQQAGLVEGPN